ncbi:hypothetical protein D3C85_640490 [compost metagenome]
MWSWRASPRLQIQGQVEGGSAQALPPFFLRGGLEAAVVKIASDLLHMDEAAWSNPL